MTQTPSVQIGHKTIGPGWPCLLIAEVAQAHDGSLGTAHAYIDAVARAGADAVKFQTHIAAAESTARDVFRTKFSPQDATRLEYWRRMEFTPEQWAGLSEHAEEAGLLFLSSPFSPEAAALLERIGVPAWKVGAGEIANLPFLKELASTKKPVLLSSGLARWEDLDRAAGIVREAGAPLAMFQCTTEYPCPPEKWGLNVLEPMRARFLCPVGFSDHSGTPFAGLAAVALGADLLEVHVTFSKECFGPDVCASVTLSELADLARGIRAVQHALANPVDKDELADRLTPLRTLFGKSIVAARPLPQGTRLSRADLSLKKPGTGIPAEEVERIVGRVLGIAVAADHLFSEDDFE